MARRTPPSAAGVLRASPTVAVPGALGGASLAIEPDGKILLIGTGGIGIVRVSSDGTLDTTFGTGGVQTITLPAYPGASIRQVAVDPSGRIVALPYYNSQ